MRLLVLGGSGFVGRSVAAEALARGHDVTVFNRGRRPPLPGVRLLTGDRLAAGGLAALEHGEWDAVVDTWSARADPVRAACALLAGRAGHYTYVSSRSVYRHGRPAPDGEHAALVDDDAAGYAGDKLRGERATAAFGGPVLLARAGLILGPHEDVGRLPWWLDRLHRGGPTLAPDPRELPLQYVDARDLAAFVLDTPGLTGAYDVVSERGHTTMGELLQVANEVTGGRAELRWADPQVIAAAGIQAWTQLPVWLAPGVDHDVMHGANVAKAMAAGLRCRPVRDTVADTWGWLRSLSGAVPGGHVRAATGLDPEVEAKVLARL